VYRVIEPSQSQNILQSFCIGLLSGDSLGSVAYSVGEGVSASGHYNAGTYNYTPYINGLNPNYTIQAINYGTFTITHAPVILSGENLAPGVLP
jgi:hypothetical protein